MSLNTVPTNYHEFEYSKFSLFKLKFMNTGRIHAERWLGAGSGSVLLGAPARTMANCNLRRGSCERGRVAPRAVHHRHAHRPVIRAPSAGCSVRSQRCVPMSQCQLGILGRRSARRAIPDGKRLHPRSQPGLWSRRCRLLRPPGCMHWDDALASLHRTGDPRVPCAAVEGHGLIDRYGHGNGTASGALGRRSPSHPVAAWSSFGARRMQEAQIGADS